MLEPTPEDTPITFWKRQNEHDKAIGLYCQSCCYRYPDECIDINTLHPFDGSAENCPDFIAKDYYKPKSRARCWLKRLEVDPDYSPLPDCELRHPIYFYSFVPSSSYYKVMTKMKALNYINYKKKLGENKFNEVKHE